LTIFLNIAYLPFLTPLRLHFEPKFHLGDGLEVRLYFKTVYYPCFLPPTKFYHILVQFYCSNFTMFVNIAYLPFLSPLPLYFVPKCHICDGLHLGLYLEIVYFPCFLPPTRLYHLLLQFRHSNLTIFFNVAYLPLLTPLRVHFEPKCHLCDSLQLGLYLKTVYSAWFLPPTKLYHLLVKFIILT